MTNIAILASGSGSNAENIAKFFADSTDIRVVAILSNNDDAFVLERARRLGIESMVFSRAELWETSRVEDYMAQRGVNYVVLAGFMLLLPPKFTALYPDAIVNIHPSLLPLHGGKGMYGHHVHEAVLAAGDAESGITIHKVNNNYDDGAIICQQRCPVLSTDTPDTLASRVHALEYEWYPRAIEADVRALGL